MLSRHFEVSDSRSVPVNILSNPESYIAAHQTAAAFNAFAAMHPEFAGHVRPEIEMREEDDVAIVAFTTNDVAQWLLTEELLNLFWISEAGNECRSLGCQIKSGMEFKP